MTEARERRLFEALYALAKAVEALTTGRGEFWQVFANIEAALVEANEALAYREDQALGDPK